MLLQNTPEKMTSKYSYTIKIPRERLAVLIGKNGEGKSEIEELTKTCLKIDSVEGDVTIEGEDSILLFSAREIVKAIARGFNPNLAKQLLKQDYSLEIISLLEILGKSSNKMMRMKGRVIGKNGKTREIVEQLTNTNISVYGKTVSIIGPVEDLNIAKRAIESLLAGSTHASVYKWLEKQKSLRRQESML